MGVIKPILFAVMLCSISITHVLAADEPETAANEEQVTDSESAASEGLMIRQETKVPGYLALEVAGQQIDATFTEETLGEQYGVIIMLHDVGEDFDSSGVISSLRRELPEHGWSTLTLALNYPYKPNIFLSGEPKEEASTEDSAAAETTDTEKVAPTGEETEQKDDTSDKKSEESEAATDEKSDGEAEDKTDENKALPPVSNQQRVNAALNFIQTQGIEKVLLLGNGEGGDFAIELLESITMPIYGLVLVGTGPLPDDASGFEDFQLPILDVIGERDYVQVQQAAKTRKLIMKRGGNEDYQQRKISGANHQFLGLEPTLSATINGWLIKQYIEVGDN